MKKAKVLFVSQEIFPYLDESPMANIGRYLPQGIQEKGKEIRTFMPRFGNVNERRNQLHEVIRLSGMNLIINDSDHPLIIKVASIQSARMQIYFIDNEEYFQRKHTLADEKNNYFDDNDERSVFFCRGVIETVRKLGWSPDIIHCHGWFTSPMPIYIKKAFKDDPLFADTKIIYSVYDDGFEKPLDAKYNKKILLDGVNDADVKKLKDPSFVNISKTAMDYSDAVIKGSEKVHPDLEKYFKSLNKPTLGFKTVEEYVDAYSNFYDEVLEESNVLAE
ncbi:MAG TPA: glycogen/starch synthase [Bacteroidia bacterium]|nr:glycogen/starch synthase [Bacteroidia bacterium]HRH09401.1 glycogen/starch synthase [Bacteroidia bacterium]HRH63628.1 glycogen/starch synthase [Bacteroidia bacterium]